MKKLYIVSGLIAFVCVFSMCNKAGIFPDSGYDDRLSGGAATIFDATSHALGNPINGLDARNSRVRDIGDEIFSQIFTADTSRESFRGLGPVFNNIACINCHRNDGEGLPTTGSSNSGLLMRLSLPGVQDANGGPVGLEGFGGQLQDQAIFGAAPEATVNIVYTDVPVTYPDGTTIILRQPAYTLQHPYIDLPSAYQTSPRLAPPLVGMGLLELIPENTILSFVDANDANGDGITGKANYVFDVHTKKKELGRFGLKANTASLLTQVATAYQQDMGITSYVQPEESAFGQLQMNAVKSNGQLELVDSLLNYVTFYVQTLAVPARRNITDADVQRGEYFFNQINCSGCHRPTIQTGLDFTLPQLSSQRIHPYTDLLVHDMGAGLADNRPDYLANGNEWRTAPLWGRGLLDKANGAPFFLHDGRARSFEEAILWHDGEAKKAKEQFMQLRKADRDRVIKFLGSL